MRRESLPPFAPSSARELTPWFGCRFYFPRVPATFGHVSAQDAIVKDGLTDVYGDVPMGNWLVVSLAARLHRTGRAFPGRTASALRLPG